MNLRVAYSFWEFGILNNLLYVVILTAAIDLVGNSTPKGVVLLADVLPSFLFKLSAPFYFNAVPYNQRILLIVMLSFVGMQLIAGASSLPLKIVGIVMASLSSGIGEVSFLQLSHYFGSTAINAWSSGTGAAGLAGSALYMVMSSWIQLPVPKTLRIFSVMPFLLIVFYYFVLPPVQFGSALSPVGSEESLATLPTTRGGSTEPSALGRTPSPQPTLGRSALFSKSKTQRIKQLLVPFILPLMTVYIAEYVINQGIAPTLLYDLKDMPMFEYYRDAYVMYGTLYQVGVFISRSSGSFFRIRKLWLAAMLQSINVLLAILQSLFMVSPSIYILFAFMVYEGLLGGAAYVNTFMLVSEAVPHSEREFSMGAVTMSDSSGVVIAALISVILEKRLCGYQIRDGRPWCELH